MTTRQLNRIVFLAILLGIVQCAMRFDEYGELIIDYEEGPSMTDEREQASKRYENIQPWILYNIDDYGELGYTPLDNLQKPTTERAHTKYGTVVGHVYRGAVSFLGIPYAKPPVDLLRWKPPQEPDRHVGELRANRHGDSCLSLLGWEDDLEMKLKLNPHYKNYNRNHSEDCLYLNVYKPYSVSYPAEGFPVMVYVHGDSYQTNSGTVYDGSILARTQQVVVVTINYRLNVFGFLNFDKSFDGNFGIMDQIAALRYVRGNIKHFNGNPNSVAIFGASAGAASVHLLLASPLAKGLFHRAIAQSGSFDIPRIWLGTRQNFTTPLFSAMSVSVGCPPLRRYSQGQGSVLDCLRNVPATELINKALREEKSYRFTSVEVVYHVL